MDGITDNENPMLSVCLITYNHEAYIREAIDSVLMQKTNFPIEIVIGEDCSTDNTRNLCIEYKEKFPDIIKLLLPEKNVGARQNFINTINMCKGKYIALCEGDDYWTDPLKLQKQVDFMEANEEYSITCHRYTIINEMKEEKQDDYVATIFEREKNPEGIIFTAQDNFKTWFTKTMTVVFRNDQDWSQILLKYKIPRDTHLFYHILKDNKGYCFGFNGAVYRRHFGGIFSPISRGERLLTALKCYVDLCFQNKDDTDLKNICEATLNDFEAYMGIGLIYRKYPFFYLTWFKDIIKLYSVIPKYIFYQMFFLSIGKVFKRHCRVIRSKKDGKTQNIERQFLRILMNQ
ncbi:MAG: glycosyltransferase [Bacteroidales bacterium]|jgi:glycosyltransferase involved in cell wall biosynthesis|nr:glycosyltransferase [Bacteroidales bacterium]